MIATALVAAVSVLATAPQQQTASLGGSWEGNVSVGGQSLRMVLRVDTSGDAPRAAIDSPDQGANGLSVEGLDLRDGTVRFAVPTASARFEGRLSQDGRTITGALTQGGSLPLILTRTAETATVARPARPQTPAPPYPYREEEARIPTPTAGVELAGTLTLPQGDGPFPAALLITGSGQQDRDETLFDHKPFAVIADALTRRGVAVLRFDDRGVGGSTGDPIGATTADFAVDAGAAFAWLAAHQGIDANRVGLIGHSEGGTIAPLVAQAGQPVAFMVLIAGPAVSGAEVLTSQSQRIQQASGLPATIVESNTAIQRRLMEAIAANAGDADAAAEAVRAAAAALPPAAIQNAEQTARRPWMRWFVAHDPALSLTAYRGPLLALYGGKDVQVDAQQSATALAAIRPDARIETFPELNHLMQTATTGLPAEYPTIEETFDPAALQALVDWVVTNSR